MDDKYETPAGGTSGQGDTGSTGGQTPADESFGWTGSDGGSEPGAAGGDARATAERMLTLPARNGALPLF